VSAAGVDGSVQNLRKLVIHFLTASCGSSSHIFSNALVQRCSSVVDSDICTFPASTPNMVVKRI